MKAFGALLTREAREQRWLLGVLSALGSVCVLGFHTFDLAWSHFAWGVHRLGLIPLLVLASLGVLITESLNRDCEDERCERMDSMDLSLPVANVADLVGEVILIQGLVNIGGTTRFTGAFETAVLL